ncbi:hypothetical protein D3C85_1638090 [compost metagenome]
MAAQVQRALDDPALKARLAEQGAEPGGMPTAEFAARIKRETATWQETASSAGIAPH